MLAIKNNLMAENTARQLSKSYDTLGTSVQRLSSGQRINSAKDDAAGMAVLELLRADVAVLQQGSRNAQDGQSMLQTAEGAMGSIDDILVRMKELAEQASTGSYSTSQRDVMNSEYTQLSAEITRIAQTTTFNGTALLNSTSAIAFQVGSSTISVTPQVMDAASLGVSNTAATTEAWTHNTGVASADNTYTTTGVGTDTFTFKFGTEATVTTDLGTSGAMSLNQLVQKINDEAGYAAATAAYDSTYGVYRLQLKAENSGVAALTITNTNNPTELAAANFTKTTTGAAGTGNDLTTATGAQAALTALDAAIEQKDSYRAALGYMMNRLQSAGSVLDIQAENLQAAQSRISDVDVATEMAKMTSSQVLAQAGISMLTQADKLPQMALQLLQG